MGSARYSARIVTEIVTVGYTLLLVFTTGVANAGDDTYATYGSIKGAVTNALTGERLRKAYVRLAPVSDAAKTRPVVTDEDGRFVFENVQPGNYFLEAEHQGLIESNYGEEGGTPVELKIVAGQTLSDVNIKLMPPAAISGRVKDEDGDSWTHADINVFRSVWQDGKRQLQGFSSAEINDAGEFRAGHLPPGRYYLSAEPDGYWEKRNRVASATQLQTTWYPSALDASSATPLVLLPGQELTGVEIRLRRNNVYRIRGKVSGLQGVPALPGPKMFMAPQLAVWPAPEEGGNTRQGVLKQDGSFEIDGVAPGTWPIRVTEGAIPAVVTLGAVAVQVDDHDVEGVSLTVQAPHLLKGVVRMDGAGEALPAGLSFSLDSSDELAAWQETASPGKDGSFAFENVPAGRHRVHVRGGSSSTYYVKRLRYGAIESSDAEFSRAAEGDTLEVILSARGARVSGAVRRNDAAGSVTAPAPQVVLLPDSADAGLRRYDTHAGALDQSGAFVVKEPVRPGEYTLYAFEGVPEGAWTDAEFMKEMDGKGIRIKVAEGDAKTVEVPLIPRSDVAALLTRLGMD